MLSLKCKLFQRLIHTVFRDDPDRIAWTKEDKKQLLAAMHKVGKDYKLLSIEMEERKSPKQIATQFHKMRKKIEADSTHFDEEITKIIMTDNNFMWSNEEHKMFLECCRLYGTSYTRYDFGTRTKEQIASYAARFKKRHEKNPDLPDHDVF